LPSPTLPIDTRVNCSLTPANIEVCVYVIFA